MFLKKKNPKTLLIFYPYQITLLKDFFMNLKYRPEIDGLRALAVIAVIFYHAQLSIQGIDAFKGGFIGVDIFLLSLGI